MMFAEPVHELLKKAAPSRAGRTDLKKFVVVHSGARDAYQLARALSEAGMLEALVTDLFWPLDRSWTKILTWFMPRSFALQLIQRSEPSLPSSRVRLCPFTGVAVLLLDKLPGVPLAVRSRVARLSDSRLGRNAGKYASKQRCRLISYSYYANEAFSCYEGPGILFQLHPHPLSVRRLLSEELQAHPECASSLNQEWELALPEEEFQKLVHETTMPEHVLVASSFTRKTLVEQGRKASTISVVPYGVDTSRFRPARQVRSKSEPRFELLFVGRINQRKGITYLLEALRLLNTKNVHLTVCGRVVDDLKLFGPFGSRVTIRPSVGSEELVGAYQAADLFVFPSVAEGFGQVLLEALACGLPILSTTHTAAPDLIEHKVQGFIVAPRRAELLAEHIEWALTHRSELAEMGVRARARAEQFTWRRFRTGAVAAIEAAQMRQREDEREYV